MWCSPHLAANFGIFELRTFHRHQVKLRYTFYPFKLKVGSKYTSKHGWLNTSFKFWIYYVCAKHSQSLWNCEALLTVSKFHFKKNNWVKLEQTVFFYCSLEKLDCVTKRCLFKVNLRLSLSEVWYEQDFCQISSDISQWLLKYCHLLTLPLKTNKTTLRSRSHICWNCAQAEITRYGKGEENRGINLHQQVLGINRSLSLHFSFLFFFSFLFKSLLATQLLLRRC